MTYNTPCTFGVSGIAFASKPTKEEYPGLQKSFENKQVSPLDLVTLITSGYSFTAEHEGDKRKENWRSAQYVAVDLENSPDASLNAVEDNQFFSAYGFCSYTTFSHTEEKPRSRAVFILTRPVANVAEWSLMARAVTGMFGGAADAASSDVSRSFLGNPDAQLRMYDKYLPVDAAMVLARQQERIDKERELSRQRDRAAYHSQDGAGVASLGKWLDDVARAPYGKRNNTLNRAAFLTGRYLVAPGKISEATAMSALLGAGMSAGLDDHEVKLTVATALRKGMTL
jgi:hypothetical protein